MCQVSPKRPHLDALMDVLQLKEHFGTLTFSFFFFFDRWGLAFWGGLVVSAETCQSPCVLCLVFSPGPELKHLSSRLKLCQRVQGP